MIKKTVGSFIAASALCISLGSINSEASQWNNSSIDQQQSSSGWAKILQVQNQKNAGSKHSYGGSSGSAQGQSAFLTGYQIQSGKSKGPATATQSEDRTVDVGDSATNGGVDQTQTTEGSGAASQSTSTSGPAYMVQSQRNSTAVYHFQGAIEGGPSLQKQMSQHHSFQISTSISRP